MNKKMFSLIGLMSLAVAAVPFAARPVAQQAKAEGETAITISAVSNQNIAGGYGLGICVIASPYTSGGYWAGITVNEKVKLYSPYGEESFMCWEEVGSQMCLNRTKTPGGEGFGHNNYYGYVLQVQEGATLDFASGNKYIANATTNWLCKLTNGTVSGDWVAYSGTSTITGLNASYNVEIGQSVTLNPSVTEDASALFFYKSANEEVATVSASGVITPVSEGTTTVTVYSGLSHQDVSVTVEAASVAQTGIKVKSKTVQTYKGKAYDFSKLEVVGLFGDTEGAAIAVSSDMISGTYDINTVGDYTLTVTSGTFSDTFTLQVIDIPVATPHAQYFGAGSPWGSQFYVNINEVADIAQYYDVDEAAKANAENYLEYNGNKLTLGTYRNAGGGRIELYYSATAQFEDVLVFKAGFPVYQYSGTMNGNFVPAGDGETVVVAEFKQDYKFVYTGSAWELDPDATVDAFIANYMHMDHTENDGSCTTEGWYVAAKTAVQALSAYARSNFAYYPKYAAAYSRLQNWATANGETLEIDETNGNITISSNSGINALNTNNVAMITIIAAVACVTLLGTALIIRKRKEVK